MLWRLKQVVQTLPDEAPHEVLESNVEDFCFTPNNRLLVLSPSGTLKFFKGKAVQLSSESYGSCFTAIAALQRWIVVAASDASTMNNFILLNHGLKVIHSLKMPIDPQLTK